MAVQQKLTTFYLNFRLLFVFIRLNSFIRFYSFLSVFICFCSFLFRINSFLSLFIPFHRFYAVLSVCTYTQQHGVASFYTSTPRRRPYFINSTRWALVGLSIYPLYIINRFHSIQYNINTVMVTMVYTRY